MKRKPSGGTTSCWTSECWWINRKPALRKWLSEDEPAVDHLPLYESSNYNGSFGDRSANGNMNQAPPASEQQLFRRLSPPATMEKLPVAASRLQSSPGGTFAPVNVPVRMPSQATPPLSRIPLPPASKLSQSLHKTVWIWTRSKEGTTMRTLIGRLCAAIEWIKPLCLEGGRFLNQERKQVALLGQVYSGEQLDYFPAMMGGTEIVVINYMIGR